MECTCKNNFCQQDEDLKAKNQSEIDNLILFYEWLKNYHQKEPDETPLYTAKKFIKWRNDWFETLNNL